MPALAFSLVGLSETLSVFAVFVMGLLVLPVAFLIWEHMDVRRLRQTPDWRAEFVHPDGPLNRGVVLADFVDEKALVSIAKQKGIEPEPTRRERRSSTTRGGDVGGGVAGVRARLSRQRHHDESELFDVEKDPNTMLAAVLSRLEQDDDLDRRVGHAPPIMLDDSTLERIRDVAQGEPEQEALATLRDRLIAAEKRAEFQGLSERSAFLLVESDWQVTVDEGNVILCLENFRRGYVAYDAHAVDPADAKPIPVPDGVAVCATVPEAGVANRGRSRLEDGGRIRAGVLATVADYEPRDGELSLAPVAIFGRYGSR